MTRAEPGRPPRTKSSPKKFQKGRHEEGVTGRHESRRDDITRPVRAQIDSRVTDRGRDRKINPAPPAEKDRADRRNDHVVRGVSGGKGRSGLGLIGVIGEANGGLLEKSHELRTGPLELDHPDSLDLLRSPAIDRALQRADENLLRADQGDEQAKNKGAPLKPMKPPHTPPAQ